MSTVPYTEARLMPRTVAPPEADAEKPWLLSVMENEP